MREDHDIDFVLLWVDSKDPLWQEKKREYEKSGEFPYRPSEFRDYGALRYWFRGVEKFAPWVRKIHFVTDAQIPDWLDTSSEKLNIVQHSDIMSEEILPVFNSNLIESYLNRIPDLAEHFVYFNDDMFLTDRVGREYFFRQGKPCDMLAFQPVVANTENPVMTYIYTNNTMALARHFDKKENIKRQPGAYFKIGYPPLYFFYNILDSMIPRFTGFFTAHNPSPMLKSVMDEVWREEPLVFEKMKDARFRSSGDVSQYLFREWAKLSGRFTPVNTLRGFRYVSTDEDCDRICSFITGQKQKVICINDSGTKAEIEDMSRALTGAFEKILPERSSFELK